MVGRHTELVFEFSTMIFDMWLIKYQLVKPVKDFLGFSSASRTCGLVIYLSILFILEGYCLYVL